ncbi:hypothetical protein M404DRAFT_1005245 [Pisolithus tinctorius Marx 270]|uniref:Uncharacterized protein n=1 Tax=Pisolithus tinctorius Marx 270 TaxID=870435 RepID=A0A0C3NBQ7_PISTI|nr:hypothetical protein M404DRAFT_1005245 [Pisolithus tinctorius Marx 270]
MKCLRANRKSDPRSWLHGNHSKLLRVNGRPVVGCAWHAPTYFKMTNHVPSERRGMTESRSRPVSDGFKQV